MFTNFKHAMQERFQSLLTQSQTLYLTKVDKELMWDMYLNSFPEDVRQEYNCNCCKQFVRHYGNVVALVDGVVKSIWDIPGCEEPFFTVSQNMRTFVSNAEIENVFFSKFKGLGTDKNVQLLEDKTTTTWNHMFLELPKQMVAKGADSVEAMQGAIRDVRNVFQRSLNEITYDAVDTVLELIAQNSLYRGTESKGVLEEFKAVKKAYGLLKPKEKDNFCWFNAPKYGGSVAKIRNTAIGTLLTNISTGMELDAAVTAFERIMAPANYKRPTALITQRMIDEAEKQIDELGYTNSLGRRFAVPDDITVNNMLFVNRNRKKSTGTLGELKDTLAVNPKEFSRTEEISAADFIEKVLPTSTSMEILFENRHINNLVSLIAPKDPEAPSMFKWPNGFSWSYKNAVTDSMKEKIKNAGGKVEGELRASLEWYNLDDLDLHVTEPGGNVIHYGNKFSTTGGNLDVDMNAGSGTTREPVENTIFPNKTRMLEGKYKVVVNQFSKRESIDIGFQVEIECQGQLLTFGYDKAVQGNVTVAEFIYSKATGITMISGLENKSAINTKTVWNIDTNKFHKASMIVESPNFWSGGKVGNQHVFFILDQAHNDEQARGFFNEFLRPDLEKHKRVFEALGSRMKVEPADKQITGLGFSVTQRDELIVKVEGTFNRILKLKF